jgi:hypothetical protein
MGFENLKIFETQKGLVLMGFENFFIYDKSE